MTPNIEQLKSFLKKYPIYKFEDKGQGEIANSIIACGSLMGQKWYSGKKKSGNQEKQNLKVWDKTASFMLLK